MSRGLHRFGKFYGRVIIQFIGIFIFIGILSVVFGDNGWMPNEDIYAISYLAYRFLLPILIAYSAGGQMRSLSIEARERKKEAKEIHPGGRKPCKSGGIPGDCRRDCEEKWGSRMNLTPRLKQIVIVLLGEENVISVRELADRIGVSKRTVQRELEYLGSELEPYHIRFESKTGRGVWLTGSSEDKKTLLAELTKEDNYDVSNRDTRRKRLILEILKEKGLKKLFYYASQFQVSEATISTDLEAVEGWLGAQQLTITRKPGSGIAVVGTEESYRRAIRTFIEENMDTKVMHEFYEKSDEGCDFKSIYGTGISQILKDDIVKRVVNCIGSMEDERVMTLTESSYRGLVLHISIAVNRILQNEIMEQNEAWQEQLPRDDDFHLAEEIVKRLEQEFDIIVPPIEVTYVCLHIKGAKHQNIRIDGEKTLVMERKELLSLINEMIDAYDARAAFLLKQDNEFIQGLLAHLQPTFIRLIYNMKISNPALLDIKKSYPEQYEKSVRAAKVLEKWIKKQVPEEEIGFLTIHFGAAEVRLEGKKENIRPVSVGIICASEIGRAHV